jgi:hypothetical protein
LLQRGANRAAAAPLKFSSIVAHPAFGGRSGSALRSREKKPATAKKKTRTLDTVLLRLL